MRDLRVPERFTAVGLLILVILLIWVSLVSPLVVEARGERQILEQNLERAARYRALQTQEPMINDALTEAESHRFPTYVGASRSEMTASFQRDIGGFASVSGAALGSVRPSGTQNQEEIGFQRLTLRVDMTGVMSQLASFLAEIERHQQIVIVEKATLRANDQGSATRAAVISMSFELVAFGETVN